MTAPRDIIIDGLMNRNNLTLEEATKKYDEFKKGITSQPQQACPLNPVDEEDCEACGS